MQPQVYIPPPEIPLPKPIPKSEYINVKYRRNQRAYRYDLYAPSSAAEVQKYAQIALNPVVKTALHILIGGTFWADFNITPQNNYEQYPAYRGLDIEILDCINNQIEEMSPSFCSLLKAILYNSMVFGYPIAEFIWDFKDGIWKVINIKNKPPYNFDFYTDEADNLLKIVHLPTHTDIEGALLEKFLIGCYPYFNNANYYGESKLLSVYHDVKLLELMEEIRATQTQALAIRPIIHYYDGERTDQDLKKVQDGLFGLESASVLSLEMVTNPDKPELPVKKDIIEVLDDRGSPETLEDIKDIIEQLQKRVTRVIGIPDDLGVTTAPVGNYAKSRNAINILFLNINDNQEYICDIVNKQIIPAMLKYNYPTLPVGYKVPKFGFQSIEEDYLLKVTQAITMLIASGALTGQEPWLTELYQNLGLPANDLKTAPVAENTTIQTPTPQPELLPTQQPIQAQRKTILEKIKSWIK